MIDPGALRGAAIFVQVVDSGGFAAAARRLGVTASAVGKAVATMEDRLGVRLLNRDTRAVSLTDEGREYHRACVAAVRELDAARSVLDERRGVPSGLLRVGLPLTLGRRRVLPVLLAVAREFPELRLEISFNDRRVDPVEEGLDLLVRLGSTGDAAGLIARRLHAQRSVLCAAPTYLDARGRPEAVADLASHDLLAYGRDGWVNPWILGVGDAPQVVHPPVARAVMGDGDALSDAAIAGMGIAWLPTWLVGDEIAAGRLEAIAAFRPIVNAEIHALWPATKSLAPKVRVVVDRLVAAFAASETERPRLDAEPVGGES